MCKVIIIFLNGMLLLPVPVFQAKKGLLVSRTQQSRYVVGRLVQDKVELSIGLVHFISFQKTEASSSQQVVLVGQTHSKNSQSSFEKHLQKSRILVKSMRCNALAVEMHCAISYSKAGQADC